MQAKRFYLKSQEPVWFIYSLLFEKIKPSFAYKKKAMSYKIDVQEIIGGYQLISRNFQKKAPLGADF